jgi:hypothetical protein
LLRGYAIAMGGRSEELPDCGQGRVRILRDQQDTRLGPVRLQHLCQIGSVASLIRDQHVDSPGMSNGDAQRVHSIAGPQDKVVIPTKFIDQAAKRQIVAHDENRGKILAVLAGAFSLIRFRDHYFAPQRLVVKVRRGNGLADLATQVTAPLERNRAELSEAKSDTGHM